MPGSLLSGRRLADLRETVPEPFLVTFTADGLIERRFLDAVQSQSCKFNLHTDCCPSSRRRQELKSASPVRRNALFHFRQKLIFVPMRILRDSLV